MNNSQRWIIRWARAGGGEVHRHNGVTWTYTPKPEAVGEIAFPRLTEAGAEWDDRLGALVRHLQRHTISPEPPR